MKADSKTFGRLSDGRDVPLFILEAGEIQLAISSFGAAWTSLLVPAKKGGRNDILLGYATLERYIHNEGSMGITVGRFANRIGGAKFSLNGKTYKLYNNDGSHSLHGGRVGYGARLWKGEAYTDNGEACARFTLESPDGDEGYPGGLKAAVTYKVNGANEITALYEASVDAPCPVNFTNHAYFNLDGEGSGQILNHELTIHASNYVAVDKKLIPTGKLTPVAGTPFDFRKPKTIGKDFAAACGGDIGGVGTGYDHCFVLDGWKERADKPLLPCAEVYSPRSGRRFSLKTTQPGVQFYSGNFLTGVPGKAGAVYRKNDGFCLETQHFPDSPNRPEFPSAIFGPDRPYSEKAVFSFFV
jgi:aldose 1-epimerase